MSMKTKQEQDKERVRLTLERIWQNYHERVRFYDHELIVLGVPRYPGDIEAVSVMDLQDVADLLAAFAEHRKEKPDELHPIKPDAIPANVEEGYVLGRDASTGAFALGARHDGGGAPQERAEPPAEPHEGDAADDPLVFDFWKPVIEIIHGGGPTHIKVWENGRTEGLDGQIINRIPQLIASLARPPVIAKGDIDMEKYRHEFEKPGGITWVAPARAPVQEEAINKIFRDLNPAALAAARTPEDVIEVIINGMAMGAGKDR